MTLTEWSQSEELQKAWRKTWEEPHMRLGLDLLRASICETRFSVSAGTDALTAGALRDAGREGFRVALTLIAIMKEGTAQPAQEPTPSYTLLPDFDTEETKHTEKKS